MTNFWVQVLYSWSLINYRDPENREEVLEQIIWMNSNILIGGKPIIWKTWLDRDIVLLRDIYDQNGVVRDDLGCNWLELRSVLQCIPESWKFLLSAEGDERTPRISLYNELSKNSTRNQQTTLLYIFI